ncbi:MAG: BCCT family transporter [Halieaceae bacterium]|nr:BCCT family transporter [Halieaceae bacterium]
MKPALDRKVFVPTFILVVAISAALVLAPRLMGPLVDAALIAVTGYFGWLYLLAGAASVAGLLWLAFGRYGRVKLGAAEEEMEFSTPSWVAMMFTAGIGIGITNWAFVEPIYHLHSPPWGLQPGSPLAAEWAHVYAQFHWSMIPWAIYALMSIPIAYALYVRREGLCRISSSSRGLLGRRSDGWLGTAIDVLVILGIIGGTSTSLGLGLPLVSGLVSECLGVPDTPLLRAMVLIIWTAIFGTSVYLGLNRGIRVLADFNAVLALIALVFVFIAGPSMFILNISTNSIGLMFDNLFRMSFWMDPVSSSGFPEDWTIFYWAWWIAYAPFVGLFVARISRGRTIRQVLLGQVIWGSLGCMAFFAVWGGYAIELDMSGSVDVAGLLETSGIPAAVVAVVGSLPGGTLTMFVFTVLCVIFLATTLDSAAYVLASISTKDLGGNADPARWNRFAWAFALAILSVGLITAGGVEAVQTSTIVAALPLIPVLIILQWSLFKWLQEDYGEALRPTSYAIEHGEDGSREVRRL